MLSKASALSSTLLLAACSTSGSGDPWIFACSREVFDHSWDGVADPGQAAIVLLFVAALPIAFDIVALPVTVPHDLFFDD